jgi:predicted small secreted protein
LLSTHAFLDKNAGRRPHICTDTNYIWDDFIKQHKNLQLVVSGHVHAESMRTDKNLAGENVYQMLADFQEEENGGNGWIRILTFSPKNNRIDVRTYSPSLNTFQDDKDSQFQLNYMF